jgi:dipeptidyl aminopeptidase/acylaminoacyl peptidase
MPPKRSPRHGLRTIGARWLLAALGAVAARADDRFDLNRLAPVPDSQQVPIGDFFRPALLADPVLSPSGTHIAAVVTAGEDNKLLLVYDVKSQRYQVLGQRGDADVSNVQWLTDARLVYQLSIQKLYGVGFYAADYGDLTDTYPLLQYRGATLIAVRRNDRLNPLVWSSVDQLRPPFRDLGASIVSSSRLSRQKGVNLLTAPATAFATLVQPALEDNDLHLVESFPIPKQGTTLGYIADKDGNLEFATTSGAGNAALFRLADRSWVPCPVDLGRWSVLGSGNRPGELIATDPHTDGEPSALRFLDASDGRPGDVLVADKGYDFVGYVHRDPATGIIVGAEAQREGPHTVWFADDYARFQQTLNHSFPGLVVRIISGNEARDFFLVAAYSDRQPTVYHWVDFKRHTTGVFKQAAPWIDPRRMLPESIIRFKTRDGRMLDAYLTLPAGASAAHPAPLVVVPHGGPWVRDNWGYNAETQFLASRGYAVLRPNYRGSPGYNWMFPEADQWDFLKMSQDVTDATRALVTTGFVDPARVAIMGGSFGGYLALKGVVDEPALYRCAVAISGVYDWEEVIRERMYDYTRFDWWYATLLRRLGDPRKEAAKFDAIAPVRHVDRIKVPVFVTHGGDDPIADIGQSNRLVSELKAHGIPFESFIVGSEGHGMAHFANRVEQYSRIEAFLARNMAPAKAP